ncbi:MAG: ABC transporter substrate-binding protein [Ilumatobacteraceae bacterium]
MSRTTRRPLGRFVLVPLAALGLVGAACGGDDDDAATTDAPSSEPGATGDTATSEPATSDTATDDTAASDTTGEGSAPVDTDSGGGAEHPAEGTIRYGMFLDLIGGTTFDPAKSVTISDERYLKYIYGTLLNRQPNGDYEPWMAESYEVTDPDTVRVTLPEGVTFSDGTPYDAEAVRAGMLRTKNEATEEAARGQQGLFKENLADIVVVDPLTVDFELNAPVAGQFLAVLSGRESMVPSPTADPASLASAPVGAGPFVLDEFVPEQSIFLDHSDTYFGDDFRFGRLEIVNTPPGVQRANALLSGEMDLVEEFESDGLPSIEGGPYDYVEALGEQDYIVLQPCPTKPPLDDVNVRRAISLAIDRQKIVDLAEAGIGEPALDLWPSDHPYFNDELGDTWAYDPEEAQRLMDESGVGEISVDAYYPQNYAWDQMNEVIRADLEKIGVTYTANPDPDVLGGFVTNQEPGFLQVPGSRIGIDKYFRYFADDAAQNICKQDYNATIIDPLKAVAGLDPSEPEVVAAFQAADKYIADNVLAIPLIYAPDMYAWSTDTIGGTVDIVGNSYHVDLSDAFVN